MHPGVRLAMRVAWDLFRIPLIHRDVRRAARGSGRSAGRLIRPGGMKLTAALATAAARLRDRRSFAAGVGATLAVAGDTLGYDFLAYHAAAVAGAGGPARLRHVVRGAPAASGCSTTRRPSSRWSWCSGCSPAGVATWAWIGGPARRVRGRRGRHAGRRERSKWWIVLLAGLSWPFLYAIKLGQVGPLLFLLFAVGWRWMDRGPVLGVSGALGAAIKIQPGLILAWALLTRRWAAVVVGAVVLGALALLATLVAGFGAWTDFLSLITRVSDPITTPHNFTPGAVAYQLGVSRDTAALLQWVSMALAALAFVVAALRLGAVPSYLVAVIASQLLSPILWDHYALLLLLPVAWLMDRGHRWAAVFVARDPGAAGGPAAAVGLPGSRSGDAWWR